jgi:6-pyruvoyl-tetrahydropterin synthase
MDTKPKFNGDFENIDLEILSQASFNMQINLSVFFNASHQVEFEPGNYGPMHRHSYQLLVKAKYTHLAGNEYYVPYATFRNILQDVARYYDGSCLNQSPVFKTVQPTTENFIQVIAYQLNQLTKELPLEIFEITLNESPTVGVTLTMSE